MAATAPSRVWADFVDEATPDSDSEAEVAETVEEKDEFGLRAAAELESVVFQPAASGDLPSQGSAQHRNARCKPCAFFHTKGCQNDKACLFCHLCPPGEKQRRKRLRERMCEKLGQPFQKQSTFGPEAGRFQKSGHLRQMSGASTGTCSTQSTCSGWTNKFSHSRQSSGASSVAVSTQEAGMGGNSHMRQMMPVYHFPQPVMSPMPVSAEGDVAAVSPSSKIPTTTIALAQAVPMPETEGQCRPAFNETTQQGPGPAVAADPYNQQMGVVQYALVPVSVDSNGQMMQQPYYTMDGSMPYACWTQQPQMPQMPPGSQWCIQVEQQPPQQFANVICAPTCQTVEG